METTTKVALPRRAVPGRWPSSKAVVKRRQSSLRKILARNTMEFCRNTSLHGIGYMSKDDIRPIEKGFFAVAFIVVLLLSIYFMLEVFVKWSTTPVIYGLNPKPSLITNEPFPAITICNLNQALKGQVAHFPINSPEYAMLHMLCRNNDRASTANTSTDWTKLPEFIRNNSQPCSRMLIDCKFGSVKYDCDQLFQTIITDEGLCCTFNMVHASFLYVHDTVHPPPTESENDYVAVDWSAEVGYPKNLPPKYYPRPAVGTGESLGLSITLDVEADNYYCSSMSSIGFKMLLHSPTESPSPSEIGLLVAAGSETKVRIRTENTNSDQHLRSVDMRVRKCAFENEITPIIFKRYTQRNCYMECLGGFLRQQCGCLSHFMVKPIRTEQTCGLLQAECVKAARLTSMIGDTECNRACLPSCYDLTFQPDFFSTPLSHAGFQIANERVKNISSEYVEQNIAIVHIYHKVESFRSNKQTEFIGFTDFLSSVGGLIGLFFGFSFISLAEFFFYIFIRPWRIVRLARRADVGAAKTEKELARNRTPMKRTRRRFLNPFIVAGHEQNSSYEHSTKAQPSGTMPRTVAGSLRRADDPRQAPRRLIY